MKVNQLEEKDRLASCGDDKSIRIWGLAKIVLV